MEKIINFFINLLQQNPEETVLGAVVVLLVTAFIGGVQFAVKEFLEKRKKDVELQILQQELLEKQQNYQRIAATMASEVAEENRKQELHNLEIKIKQVELEDKKFELNKKKRHRN